MGSWKPVEIKDREQIMRYMALYPDNEGSECTFSNLFIWGQAEHVHWKIDADCLLIRARARGTTPCMLMAFAEPSRMGEAIDTAVRDMQERGEQFRMCSLPLWYCDIMREHFPGRFQFEREPHHDDYVYRTADLISLSGKKLHGKRNHINRFLGVYADRYAYEPYTPLLFDDCMRVYERWLSAMDPSPELREEKASVERALRHAADLQLIGGTIRVDGEVKAFSVGEIITGDMALIHIEKASPDIPELFAMINREFATHSFSELTWINREEDMGNEGLRRAKRSYNPARMIEKYGAALAKDGE